MIPLKDNISSKRVPVITIFLIALNVIIYIIQSSLVPDFRNLMVYVFGFVPERISMSLTVDVGFYPMLTFITSIFLHGNLLHLIGNMLYLWIFGDNVEDVLGKFKFLLFYLLVGIIGNIAHYLSDPLSQIPAIGASGAVAGVLGAYYIFFPRAQILTLVPLGIFITAIYLPSFIFLGVWILLQGINALLTLPGSATSVAWWAHVGGFVAGFVLGLFTRKK